MTNAVFTTPFETAAERATHATALANFDVSTADSESLRENFEGYQVCDGFRVPDQTVLVSRSQDDQAASSFLEELGSSMTSSFWVGSLEGCEAQIQALVEWGQRCIPNGGLDPDESDRMLIGLWHVPSTGKALVGAMACGDWAASEDDAVFESGDQNGLTSLPVCDDLGYHNIFDCGILEEVEDDEAAALIETVRLVAATKDSWDELREILGDENEDALRVWKKTYKSKKTPKV